MDVLEIDGATYTGVDAVREVIVEPLAIAPMRDRFKIFIIDEVHRLSKSAFDALLKSIEEPPPYVKFMMATTDLHSVPATIQSRSQVFELKALPFSVDPRAAAGGHRRARSVQIDDAALALVARSAEGSMRDALSALDQVLAFTSDAVTAADVSTVLGLIGRDLQFDIAETVAREDVAGAFALAGVVVEAGFDLRIVCRELARLMRDLMVVRIDPTRLADPEIAAEGERDRLQGAGRAVLARRSDARVRSALDGRVRDPQLVAAAPSVRDGAGEVDSPPPADAAGGDRRRTGKRAEAGRQLDPAVGCQRPGRKRSRRTANFEQSNAGPSRSRSRSAPATGSGVGSRRRVPTADKADAPAQPGDIKAALLSSIRDQNKSVLRHGDRAGAEGRGRRGFDRLHVRAGPQEPARAARKPQARGSSSWRTRRAGGRSRSSRAKAAAGAGGVGIRRSGHGPQSRRSAPGPRPSRPSRPCSTSSAAKSKTWKRLSDTESGN